MEKTSCKYFFFNKVNDDTPLGRLFNEVFNVLEIPRSISAPADTTVDGWENSEKSLLFYKMCLMEQYLHSIMDNLSKWQTLTEKYAKEFHYSWKYYALSNRIDLIKEFGGDDDDYNEDGSIRTDFSDEELINDTILSDLADPQTNSIFLSTTPMNCLTTCNLIVHLGANSIFDFFKNATGKPIRTYRKNEDGKFIQNDWIDDAMIKAEEELAHDHAATLLWSVLLFIYSLVCKVKELSKTEDNMIFFKKLPKLIDTIFNLKIPLLKLPDINNLDE